MKDHIKFMANIVACVLAAMFMAISPATADPAVTPVAAAPQVKRSVFTLPASPKDGRDPFFPSSTRPYEGIPVPGVKSVTDIHSFTIQGFSGVAPRLLVIINNVTFGVGDEAEVRTPEGRVRIHCVGITDNSAVVEFNGQQHTLQKLVKP